MSLNYDLKSAKNDVENINFEQEYDELISDILAVYNLHRYTFKNAIGENSGEIVDLLIEHCKKDFFAYAALVYVLCVEAEMSNEAVLSYTTTYKQTLKKLREEAAERDALLNTKEACWVLRRAKYDCRRVFRDYKLVLSLRLAKN